MSPPSQPTQAWLKDIRKYFDSLSEDEIMGDDRTIYVLLEFVEALQKENAELKREHGILRDALAELPEGTLFKIQTVNGETAGDDVGTVHIPIDSSKRRRVLSQIPPRP